MGSRISCISKHNCCPSYSHSKQVNTVSVSLVVQKSGYRKWLPKSASFTLISSDVFRCLPMSSDIYIYSCLHPPAPPPPPKYHVKYTFKPTADFSKFVLQFFLTTKANNSSIFTLMSSDVFRCLPMSSYIFIYSCLHPPPLLY